MAIYKEDLVNIDLENGNIFRSFLTHTIGSGDNSANRFGVKVYRAGVAEDLSGCSCQAIFMNNAGVNIALTSYGTVSGNVAYVTLPQACYNVEGQFCLAIKLVNSGVTVTSRIVDGVVCNTGTTGSVAPTSSVPTYQEVLAVYDAAIAAVDDVNDLKSAIDDISTIGKQLFDVDHADTKHIIPSNGAAAASTNGTSVIIPISPSANDNYVTVHRSIITSRFMVATFTTYPNIGTSVSDVVTNDSAASITIGIDTTIKYLMVYCHLATQDTTVTVAQELAGLMVEYGSSYTGYEEFKKIVVIPDDYITSSMFADDVPEYIEDILEEENVIDFVDGNMQTSKTSTSVTLTWTEGSYYSLTTGELTTLSGRAYSQKTACKAGDVLEIKNNKGQLLFWDNKGAFLSYVATDYPGYVLKAAPTNAAYFALNNSDSSIRATVAINNSAVSDLIEAVYDAPAKLLYDSSHFTNSKYASTSNGTLSDITSTWYCGIALPCKALHKYRTESQTQVVFYNSSMTFISALLPKNSASYTGTQVEMDFTTPANCAYMCINTYNAHEKVFDMEPYTVVGDVVNPHKLNGLKILAFGDSITGNYGFGDNISYFVENGTGAKTYNAGFGGCRMEKISETGSAAEIAALTNPFAMCELVDQLALPNTDPDKWAAQDTAAAAFIESPRFNRIITLRLDILKTIDLENIDIVTIAYGTNEAGYPQDNPENPYDKYTYAGATRYSIEKLLEINPKLHIVLLTPIYRHSFSSGSGDSDSYVNSDTGLSLLDNINTLKSVGLEYKVPVIDMYHDLGINKENYETYFGDEDEPDDGTHVNSYGRATYWNRLSGELNRLF